MWHKNFAKNFFFLHNAVSFGLMRVRISSCVPNEIKKKNLSKKKHVFKKKFKKKPFDQKSYL